MAEKKSHVTYDDWWIQVSLLSMEERGQLWTAIFAYRGMCEPPELTPCVNMAFSFIRAQLDRDQQKYLAKCEKNKANGSKGGRPPKPKGTEDNPQEPKETERFSREPKKPDKGYMIDDRCNMTDDIPPISPAGIDERFSQFWAAYPKKVGKGAAEKSFKKIKSDSALLADMLQSIATAKQSEQWQRDNGQYIPNPSTWLNQRRWEDELTNPLQSGEPKAKLLGVDD